MSCQKDNKGEVKDAIIMIAHHISHFLLSSRLGGKYENKEIEKSFPYIDKLKSLLPQNKSQIDEFDSF